MYPAGNPVSTPQLNIGSKQDEKKEKAKSDTAVKAKKVETKKDVISAGTMLFGKNTSSEFTFAAIAAKFPPGAFGFGSKTCKYASA